MYVVPVAWSVSAYHLQIYVVDNQPRQPQSVWNQESQPLPREERYGDSSGQFFSVYTRIAKEKDDKMTQRWQKDADSMLVFVGPCVDIHYPHAH